MIIKYLLLVTPEVSSVLQLWTGLPVIQGELGSSSASDSQQPLVTGELPLNPSCVTPHTLVMFIAIKSAIFKARYMDYD